MTAEHVPGCAEHYMDERECLCPCHDHGRVDSVALDAPWSDANGDEIERGEPDPMTALSSNPTRCAECAMYSGTDEAPPPHDHPDGLPSTPTDRDEDYPGQWMVEVMIDNAERGTPQDPS